MTPCPAHTHTHTQTGLDWIGLDWIGLDWIGLDWIGLESRVSPTSSPGNSPPPPHHTRYLTGPIFTYHSYTRTPVFRSLTCGSYFAGVTSFFYVDAMPLFRPSCPKPIPSQSLFRLPCFFCLRVLACTGGSIAGGQNEASANCRIYMRPHHAQMEKPKFLSADQK